MKTDTSEKIKVHFWQSNPLINQTNKSLTFRLYKENVTIAPYLLHVKNRKYRRTMSKLRLSDHNLEVEISRHTKPKTNHENRICKLCTDPNIEDEVHFLLRCKNLKSERLLLE